MDIRHVLAIGVDDDLVDQLDQLVVGRGGQFGFGGISDIFIIVFHAGKQIADRSRIFLGDGAIEGIDRLLEFLVRADLVDELGAREDIAQDPAALDAFGIDTEDDDAILGVVQGEPLVLFDIVALEIFQEFDRLDAVSLERFVGHAEEL